MDILIHGTSCSKWGDGPITADELLALQLVRGESEDVTVWVCPVCQVSVIVQFDYGELDFGVEPLLDNPEPFFETFEPVSIRKELP